MHDLYSILGLSRHAKPEEIRAAYWTQAKRSHPDVNIGASEAERRTKEINFAYETLGDPLARAAYDLELLRLRAKARRNFWSAAALGAATFMLMAGSVTVALMWIPHARIRPSLGGDAAVLTRIDKGESAVELPPAPDRGNLRSAWPENSQMRAASHEQASPPPRVGFVESPAASNSEFAGTPPSYKEAQSPIEPIATSLWERPDKEQVKNASSSELVGQLQVPELLAVPQTRDREVPQQRISSPGSTGEANVARPNTAAAKEKAGSQGRRKRAMAMRLTASQASGYEVAGCAFYALVEGKTVQRCPSSGSPGNKPFWYNDDAFEGGYGGGPQ